MNTAMTNVRALLDPNIHFVPAVIVKIVKIVETMIPELDIPIVIGKKILVNLHLNK